ncbi:hypothetical protein OAD33_03595 [Alphaproteobacteria bacterium]|nr:hypothetical protein [Alphaproteobacteria bacterium]
MSLLGSAVLVNWGGIVESKEAEYNSWHSKEHMPERIALPGFLRGCRAIGIPETNINHKYFMMYEAERKDVFVSRKYLERLNNPSKWTKNILSNYISPSRTICSVITSKSVGFGGWIGTVRFLNKDIESENHVEKLKLSVPQTIKLEGITGMHVLLGEKAYGQMETQEKSFRSNQGLNDQIITQAIIIEGLNYFSLEKAILALKQEYSLEESDHLIINYYQIQHILTKQDLIGI